MSKQRYAFVYKDDDDNDNDKRLSKVSRRVGRLHVVVGVLVLAASIALGVVTILRGSTNYYVRPITVGVASGTPGSSTVVYHLPVLALVVVAGVILGVLRIAIGAVPYPRIGYTKALSERYYLDKDETYQVRMARSVVTLRWIAAVATYPFVAVALASLAGVTDIMLLVALGAVAIIVVYALYALEMANSYAVSYSDVVWLSLVVACLMCTTYYGIVITFLVARLVAGVAVPAQVAVAVFASFVGALVIGVVILLRYTQTRAIRKDISFEYAYTITEATTLLIIAIALSVW